MKLSVIIPARNEEKCIAQTVWCVRCALNAERIEHEIIVVDDSSTDNTFKEALGAKAWLVMSYGKGFGLAVRYGLKKATGDIIAIMMADGSDDPRDLVHYYYSIAVEHYDMAFGSRFIQGSKVDNYPAHKLVLNRLANWFIRKLYKIQYNDITNAFKAYRRSIMEWDYEATDFSLLAEMPLKALKRSKRYLCPPISWTNRRTGYSKFKIRELGSSYLRTILKIWWNK